MLILQLYNATVFLDWTSTRLPLLCVMQMLKYQQQGQVPNSRLTLQPTVWNTLINERRLSAVEVLSDLGQRIATSLWLWEGGFVLFQLLSIAVLRSIAAPYSFTGIDHCLTLCTLLPIGTSSFYVSNPKILSNLLSGKENVLWRLLFAPHDWYRPNVV